MPVTAGELAAAATPSGSPVDPQIQARAAGALAAAAQTVNDYAASAPEALRDEATIRFGVYLLTASPATARSLTVGPISADYVVNHGPAFRNCGAAMLLSRYRVRRAGTIG